MTPKKSTQKGHIIIISGPSGVGKGTVIREILKSHPSLRLSVSATTRHPRPGEINGRDYHFLSKKEFEALIAKDAFLEWCEVHHHYYGTLVSAVQDVIQAGHTIILEIDTQGAQKVKKKTQDVTTIFLTPPSIEELSHRLESRNTESEETLAHRLKTAKKELAEIGQYDFFVVNKDVQKTAQEVCDIISSLDH